MILHDKIIEEAIKICTSAKKTDSLDGDEIEKYTGYEKMINEFNHNGVKVASFECETSGNDYDGFDADIKLVLSNGVKIIYTHGRPGKGLFAAKTKKGTDLISKKIDLNSSAIGYAPFLNARLKELLDFNF